MNTTLDARLERIIRDPGEGMARRQIAGCGLAAAIGQEEEVGDAIKQAADRFLGGVERGDDHVAVALAPFGRRVMELLCKDDRSRVDVGRMVVRQIADLEPDRKAAALSRVAADACPEHDPWPADQILGKALATLEKPIEGSGQRAVVDFARETLDPRVFVAHRVQLADEALKGLEGLGEDMRISAVAGLAARVSRLHCRHTSTVQRVQNTALDLAAGLSSSASVACVVATYGLRASLIGPSVFDERSFDVFYDEHRLADAAAISSAAVRVAAGLTGSPAVAAMVNAAEKFEASYVPAAHRLNVNRAVLEIVADGGESLSPDDALRQLTVRCVDSAPDMATREWYRTVVPSPAKSIYG
jgi:hypothetical protein